MFLNWIDESATPGFTMRDRMIQVIHSLKVTTKQQLITVTGWSEMQVEGAIKRIKKMGGKGNSEDWLVIWKTANEVWCYTLGKLGTAYAKSQREEAVKEYQHDEAQANHYLGTNEILCRLIRKNVKIDTWLSSGEISSKLYYDLAKINYTKDKKIFINYPMEAVGKFKIKRPKIPVRPDGYIEMGEHNFLFEYETGGTSTQKVDDKFPRYVILQQKLLELGKGPLIVIWVSASLRRKNHIEKNGELFLSQFDKRLTPTMYSFLEGEDTRFLCGEMEAAPFWEGN